MSSKKFFLMSIGIRIFLLSIGLFFLAIQFKSDDFTQTHDTDSIDNAVDASVVGVASVPYDSLGFTELGKAASRGDIGAVMTAINSGANLNIQSQNIDAKSGQASGNTPLHFALWDANYEPNFIIAQMLINAGASVLIPNSLGNYPVHTIMVPINYDTSATSDKRKLLLCMLIKHGADINAKSGDGTTLVHMAIADQEKDWIFTLRDYFGLLINFSIPNNDGLTAFQLAKQVGATNNPLLADMFKAVIDVLSDSGSVLAHGVNIYASPVNTTGYPSISVSSGDLDIQGRDIMGLTILMIAVIRKDQKLAQLAVDRGVDVNARSNDTDKNSAYALAASGYKFIKPISVANSALHFALIHQSVDMVNFLTSLKNIQPNIQNGYGDTPLHYIFKINSFGSGSDFSSKRLDAARSILKSEYFYLRNKVKNGQLSKEQAVSKSSINIANNDGDTPLVLAVKHHAKNLVQMILDEFVAIKSGKDVPRTIISRENFVASIRLAHKLAISDPINAADYNNIAQILSIQYCNEIKVKSVVRGGQVIDSFCSRY